MSIVCDMDVTHDMIEKQLRYQEISIMEGEGMVNQLYCSGPFVVYSRTSTEKILSFIRNTRAITSLEEMKTIFLLGPTPAFFGEKPATTSWRRAFLEYLTVNKLLDDGLLIVLPEPFSCNWKDVDYPSLQEPMEHIYSQVHWEDYFIDLAVKTGVLVLHAHFNWKGNAGPTARFEGGKLLSLLKENKLNAAVINQPKDSQTIQYITSHVVHGMSLYREGRFKITQCSPLNLNEQGVPVDTQGNIVESGLYADGSIEHENLDPFYQAVVDVANH